MKTQSLSLGEENLSHFSAFYQTYYPILYRYGKTLVQDEELVIDTVQELFIYLWEKRVLLNQVKNPYPYMMRAFRRRLFKQVHKVRSHQQRFLYLNEAIHIEHPDVDSAEEIILKRESATECRTYVQGFLASLSPRRREVVMLRYYYNFSYQEIAEQMGIKYQTVLNHLQAVFNQN